MLHILLGLAMLIAFAAEAHADSDRGGPPLDGLSVVVPAAKGKSTWGTADLTEGARLELRRAIGSLIKAEALTGAQLEILATTQTTDDLETMQKKMNTPAQLARAGRLIGAQYIVRITVVKTLQAYQPTAAIIDVESGEIVEQVRAGRYKKPLNARDAGRSVGRAVVAAMRSILTLARPPVVFAKRPSEEVAALAEAKPAAAEPAIIKPIVPEESSEGSTEPASDLNTEIPASLPDTSADSPSSSSGMDSTELAGDAGSTGASFSVDALLGDAGITSETEDPIEVFLGLYAFQDLRVDATHESEDNDESQFDSWSRLFMFIEPKIGTTTKFRLSADLDLYAQKKLGGVEPIYNFDLEEAYFFHAFDFMQIKIGRQIATWGVMDTLSPENVLNPRDVRFSLVKANEQGLDRVPVLMARGLVPIGAHTFDMVFIPFVPVARAYFMGTDFSMLRPGLFSGVIEGFKQRITRTLPVDQQPIYLVLADSLSEFGRNMEAQNTGQDLTLDRAPENLPTNFGGGARLSGSFEVFDYGLSFLTAHELTPRVTLGKRIKDIFFDLPKLEPEEALAISADLRGQFDVTFPRYLMFGADAGVQLWRFFLKAEATYRTLVTYYDVDLNPVDAQQIDAAIHLEYVQGSEVTIILEALRSHVITDQLDKLILFKQDNTTLLGRFNFSLFRDRLDLRFDGAYNLKYKDFYLAPSAAWDFTDQITLKVGADLYFGPEGKLDYDTIADPNRLAEIDIGTFSYYRGNSFIYSRLTYGF